MTSIRLKERLGVISKGDDTRSSTTSAYMRFDPIIANLDFSVHVDKKSINMGSGATVDPNMLDDTECDHLTDNEVISKERKVWLRALQSNYCKCIDIASTALIIALVWMMMALPTVVYINTLVRHLCKCTY